MKPLILKAIIFLFLTAVLVWAISERIQIPIPPTPFTGQEIEIKGYVIDEKNKPVQGAKVYWAYEPEIISREGLITNWQSYKDGYFGFTANWIPRKNIRIIIAAPIQNNCFNPIDILDKRLANLPQFQGLLITRYKPSISFGKVSNYIRFGKIDIDLKSQSPSFIERVNNRLVYLRIRDFQGSIISDKTINPAYLENSRKLEFCLPEGEWDLELREDNKIISIQPQKVVVDSAQPIKVDIDDSRK